MYVKVSAGDRPYGGRGDFIIEVNGPVNTGISPTELPSHQFDASLFLTSTADLNFDDMMNASLGLIHVLELRGGVVAVENHNDQTPLVVRWAWWEGDDGIEAVVTSRDIFIVGANGKTIDRV